MDLSAPLPVAASSNGKISKLAPSKRALFLASYQRNQTWSLPDSLIYYIAKNPLSPKCYEKLIKSSKYFFIKNPILIVPHLSSSYKKNEWRAYFNDKQVDIKNIAAKIWVIYTLYFDDVDGNQDSLYCSSSIVPLIYQSDIIRLSFCKQDILLHDFVFIASKCCGISFKKSAVINDDGSVVSLEEIVKVLPYLKDIYYDLYDAESSPITSSTVQELIKIPHFSTLTNLNPEFLPDSFDIDGFYDYIKKNKQTDIRLRFSPRISDACQHRLQSIVNEIIETENHEYKVPLIAYPGIDLSTGIKLLNLHRRA